MLYFWMTFILSEDEFWSISNFMFINLFKSKFNKKSSIDDNVFLSIQDSSLVQSRDRSRDFENQRQQVFEAFTLRESSLFERVKAKTTVQEVTIEISNERNEVVSIFQTKRRRERERKRERKRERSRDRKRDKRRNKDRDRDIQKWNDQTTYKWMKWFESFKSIELRTFKRECIFKLKTK